MIKQNLIFQGFFYLFSLVVFSPNCLAQNNDESAKQGIAGFNKTIHILNLSLFSFFVVSLLIFVSAFLMSVFASGNEKILKTSKVLFIGALVLMTASLIGYIFTNFVKYYLI